MPLNFIIVYSNSSGKKKTLLMWLDFPRAWMCETPEPSKARDGRSGRVGVEPREGAYTNKISARSLIALRVMEEVESNFERSGTIKILNYSQAANFIL